jgi:hypothetical protein
MFAGGLAGSEAGGLLGQAGEAVGLGVGSIAGMRAADARSGLPANMLIGVSATMVYGFAAATRHSEPTSLVFRVPRAGLTVKVHQRVNVRVLELIDNASDARIELEGNRLPVTHPPWQWQRPRVPVGVRQRPARRERPWPQRAVRLAAHQHLPDVRRRRRDPQPHQQLPQHHLQPLPRIALTGQAQADARPS